MSNYGSLEGFGAYHTARGNDVADLTPEQIDTALLVASEYLDNAFRSAWPGRKRLGREQVRDWPRYNAHDVNKEWLGEGIPREVEYATYEVAIKHAKEPGSLLQDWTPNRYSRARVNGASDITYVIYQSASDIQTRLVQVERILSNILSNHQMSSLSGAAVRG